MGRGHYKQNRELTFRANMGVGRHGWLRLTPAYGMRIVRDRIAHLPEGSVITDPFSGTGTTPLAAAELGYYGQSIDLNPFLVWLGRVKTRHYSGDALDRSTDALEALVSSARDQVKATNLWQPKIFKIERWWSAGNLQGLKAVRSAIDTCDAPAELKDLFEIALCRTLIDRSNAAFNHQSMSFKDADDGYTLFRLNDATETVAKFNTEAAAIIDSARYDLIGSANVVEGDSRHSVDNLEPCDLILTSPPYANRMSYIRELRPYMYWLRFLEDAADAGDLDTQAIGGTWGVATSNLKLWTPTATSPIDEEIAEVCARIAEDGKKNGPLLSTYVHKYFHDMWTHFEQVTPLVKDGGSVSYIVGNSTFYGHEVPTHDWYARMLKELGYNNVQVEIIRKRNSNKALYEYDVSAVRGCPQ